MPRILIIDDESTMVMTLRDELLFEGFEVESASDGPAGIEKAREQRPDVLILDLKLPGMNGFEVCRNLRPEMPGMWIIMLTIRAEEVDRVRGLEIGADDYVTKPFSLRELMARVKAGLRRVQAESAPTIQRFGDIEIESRSRRVTKKGVGIPLTRKEFDMLELLVRRSGEVITRDEFLDAIWGKEIYVTPRVVDTHIAALRKKLKDDPNNPRHIQGVHGVGYKLVSD